MPDRSKSERRQMANKGQAIPDEDRGGRFPIKNCEDVGKAVRAIGRVRPATEEARAKVRRFVIKRARALGCDGIPESWNSDGTLKS